MQVCTKREGHVSNPKRKLRVSSTNAKVTFLLQTWTPCSINKHEDRVPSANSNLNQGRVST